MIRIRAPSTFRGTYRAGVQQQRQQYQQHHNNVDVAARPHLLGNQRYVVSTKSAGEQRREPRRRLPETPGLKIFCRHLASASGGGSSGSSSSSSSSSGDRNRSYLERWAGIRGRVASGTKAASLQAAAGAGAASPSRTPSSSPSAMAGSSPSVSFFGRTYLLSTIRLPPFPPPPPLGVILGGASPSGRATLVNGSGGGGGGGEEWRGTVGEGGRQENRVGKRGGGGWKKEEGEEEEEEEEQRVFDWMRGALRGSGALGVTGFFPGAGSPVVLDLGAVAQDGSPHGRPAGRAALAGAARAVKAAGLVPVGVCNTSHDVLQLASAQGLPEIMMVQTRPRSSQESSPALTAATLRAQTPQHIPERSLERASSTRSCSERSSERSPSRSDSLPRRKENERHASCSSTVCQPTVPERPPSESAEQPVPVGVSGAVVASTEDGDAMGSRDGALDGANSEGKQGADRETMVYEGSVRSGQQVYAEGTSLVVIGAVSSGGEVMADGDIHVYGTLRGRALAGLSGSKSAKIFATRFDAELVGVGDTFTTCDDPDSLPGLVVETPTNVCLRQNKLVFQSFDLSSSHQS